MKVLELFAGERCIGKAFEEKGHKVFSVDWDKQHKNINLYADISKLTAEEILEKFGRPDVIWASPDCTSYSIAAISTHRKKNEATGELEPVSDYAKFYFIENPRGGLRKMKFMQGLPRYTITYCQYGDVPGVCRSKRKGEWVWRKYLKSLKAKF